VVDYNELRITGSIALQGWAEKMVFVPSTATCWVLSKAKPYLFLIDTRNNVVYDSVYSGVSAMDMVYDPLNKQVWVCGTGNNQEPGFLKSISVENRQLVKNFSFPANQGPTALAFNYFQDSLFYLRKDVFVLPSKSIALPTTPFFAAGNRNFYSLYCNSYGLWLSDAKDYVQASDVYWINGDASIRAQFKAGINTSSFWN